MVFITTIAPFKYILQIQKDILKKVKCFKYHSHFFGYEIFYLHLEANINY